MGFQEKLNQAVKENDSLLCIGLDPSEGRLPPHLEGPDALFDFGREIVDATAGVVCAYKPNAAFYEASGSEGVEQLEKLCEYLRKTHPDIPYIVDAKRADIGKTNKGYTSFVFNTLKADATTVNPYFGRQALEPFLEFKDKGIIVLCRTSNDGAEEFQDLVIEETGGKKLFQVVAENVKNAWNENGNCLLVVGATYPEEAADLRQRVGDEMWFLMPGVGTQGADTQKAVLAGINSQGEGIIVNSGSDIIFASSGRDFAKAALAKAINLRDEINRIREKAA